MIKTILQDLVVEVVTVFNTPPVYTGPTGKKKSIRKRT